MAFVRSFLDCERLFDMSVAANSGIFSAFYLFLYYYLFVLYYVYSYVFVSEKFPMNIRSLIIALLYLSIYAAD